MAQQMVLEKQLDRTSSFSLTTTDSTMSDQKPEQADHISHDDVEAQNINLTLTKTTTRPSGGNKLTTALSQQLSKIRTCDTIPLTPPPDGGTRAWMTAALSHFVIFNTWGFINSFGLFQTYYVETAKIGSNSAVAWIGSAQVCILFSMGTFSGRALDAGYFRIIFAIGSVVYIFGMFMLSLATTYWQIFLAQAVCIGIGFGMVFVPTIALVSTYFLAKRSTALAVTVTGSASGGLVFPAIAKQMLPTVGFAWTVRTMAFVQVIGAVLCIVFMKPRLPPRKSGPVVEWSAFKELPYTLYLCGAFFFFWSAYIGYFYVGSFGRNILGVSQSTSITLLLVMNGVGILARVLPNYLADRYTGPLNMIMPFIFGTGVISYAWAAVDSVTGLWGFAIFYGVTAAGIQGLFPVVLTSLTSDPKKAGVRAGMGFGVVSIAVLTGPPIAGALIEAADGSYIGPQVFGGSAMMISIAFLLATRWSRVGFKLIART